jgi:dynein assembly factor with WDR repeat domains 1
LSFDPHAALLATGAMDYRANLWDVETGKEYTTLKGHKAEVVSLHFCAEGDKIITGSFDSTGKIWDVRTGNCVYTLDEHTAEISNALFDFTGDYVATCSLDR